MTDVIVLLYKMIRTFFTIKTCLCPL